MPIRAAIFIVLATYAVLPLPLALIFDFNAPQEPMPGQQIVLRSSDGIDSAVLSGPRKLAPIEKGEVPLYVANAFIASEDRNFRSHFGISARGIARAAVADLSCFCAAQGGSTIEAQTVKNAYLSSWPAPARKLAEVPMAIAMNLRLKNKEVILDRYLDAAYFGQNQYGLRAAARHYFNRRPDQLNISQAAWLAAILPAPSDYSRPKTPKVRKRVETRFKQVLDVMAKEGWITAGQRRRARMPRFHTEKTLPTGTWFADYAVTTEGKAIRARGAGGELFVSTTQDAKLQAIARRAVTAEMRGLSRRVEVSLVAMRPDGAIVAMVGGRRYPRGMARVFSRATASRQTGSVFKTVDLLAALRGGVKLNDWVLDAPTNFDGWSPRNYDRQYRGWMRVIDAFAESRNVPLVKLANEAGLDEVTKAARDLGLPVIGEPNLTMALGTHGATTVQLAAAYAAIASGRYPVVPYVLAPNSAVPKASVKLRHLKEAPEICKALRQVIIKGTGRKATTRWTTYGKSGTTSDARDALFVGIVGDLVIAVRIGRDDARPMPGMRGGDVPARIFQRFANAAIAAGKVKPHRCGYTN